MDPQFSYQLANGSKQNQRIARYWFCGRPWGALPAVDALAHARGSISGVCAPLSHLLFSNFYIFLTFICCKFFIQSFFLFFLKFCVKMFISNFFSQNLLHNFFWLLNFSCKKIMHDDFSFQNFRSQNIYHQFIPFPIYIFYLPCLAPTHY